MADGRWASNVQEDEGSPQLLPDRSDPNHGDTSDVASNESMHAGILRLARTDRDDTRSLMGKAWRSMITGTVKLGDVKDFPHFGVVDFWSRPRLSGALEQFCKDKYLFRPQPLLYRTWIYHYYYKVKKVLPGVDECNMLRFILEHRCIDKPVNAGRWSPVMCYQGVVLAVCLTGDIISVIIALALFIGCYVTAVYTNEPNWYRYQRLFTLPFRLSYVIFILARIKFEAFAVLGTVAAFGIQAYDLYRGDYATLKTYSLHCTYEVIRPLPNRTFICRRHGAADLEGKWPRELPVDECITGMGSWDQQCCIISDINGLICELVPMKAEDWKVVHDEYHETCEPASYFAFEMYSETRPFIDCADASPEYVAATKNKYKLKRMPDADGGAPGEAASETPVTKAVTIPQTPSVPRSVRSQERQAVEVAEL